MGADDKTELQESIVYEPPDTVIYVLSTFIMMALFLYDFYKSSSIS